MPLLIIVVQGTAATTAAILILVSLYGYAKAGVDRSNKYWSHCRIVDPRWKLEGRDTKATRVGRLDRRSN
ncbi:hypothetical protein VN12_21955 [Pirellula sp. SH-Sr6A]|nr:hypothetical protein VN12_21955 [Pirellula sp. SH-Sr6A]